MIKLYNILFASAIFVSCNSSSTKTAEKETDTLKFAKGKALFAQNNCGGCHAEKDAIIGPSFSNIAAEYEASQANIAHLAHVVIIGVKPNEGVWGSREMTPHLKLSPADAEEIVKYMLSFPPDPNKPFLHNTK
ncbi:c-type cytochrome [Arcticibacter eurypsychrophilus]|uniref:c-type cytochrome n=1 Tax=Arcticibacter eurypsychrophilus TaxID=1434752 RepID=UPI00084D7ACC|nr:c-type cytochrome [Arcticibacter eurypsychrophilus]